MVQVNGHEVIKRLNSGQINILVATDFASRRLDINDINHVLNFIYHVLLMFICTVFGELHLVSKK